MTLMSHLHKADGLGVPKERGADRVMSSILLSWAFKPARVMSSIFRVMSSILKLPDIRCFRATRVMSSIFRVMSSILSTHQYIPDAVGIKHKTPLPQSP